MEIVVTGANGFIGRKLVRRLLERGALAAPDGVERPVERILAVDSAAGDGPPIEDPRVETRIADLTAPGAAEGLVGPATSSVFHLAAIPSAGAEADFERGMAVNLDVTRRLLDACRALGTAPAFVFSSTVAVFGGDLPDVIRDDTAPTPQTSYGAQKAMSELLISDLSRRGFIDGRALRLPTVVVRPGKPNTAASTFASSIIREPLQGERAVLPVRRERAMYVLSPRRVVDSLIHAHGLPGERFGPHRTVTLPGLTVSVADMLAGLERAGGREALDRVEETLDPHIDAIVAGWPGRFEPARARALGFEADPDYDAIVAMFMEEDRVVPAPAGA
ncbi:MAG: SDR family oxidoreductase [Azospirillaceae bacterium]